MKWVYEAVIVPMNPREYSGFYRCGLFTTKEAAIQHAKKLIAKDRAGARKLYYYFPLASFRRRPIKGGKL